MWGDSERFHERGLGGALYDAPRPGQKRVLDDKGEAHLIALACSKPPDGYECWTIGLMKTHLDRRVGKPASKSTIARILMANDLKPWQQKNVVCGGTHA